MKYTSEIIQKVVTSEGCLRAIERISPIYADAENFLYILNAIFEEVDVFVGYGKLLQKEAFPQTAEKLLDFWEQEYGISRDISLNTEERRERILAKIRARASMNPYKLKAIIEAETGVLTYIEENTGKNTFTVRLIANNQAELRHGMQIENLINRYKPAHLICKIQFEMVVRDNLNFAGVVRTVKSITLNQN